MRTSPQSSWSPAAIALLAATALAPQTADAQIRGSERGSVSQTVDGTTITVEYSRPGARGRDLFGSLVPWGVTWTPGANWATTLEASKNIKINGVDVEAGAYSVWMTPRDGAWTLTLNENTEYFHFQKPDTAEARYNIEVMAEAAPHREMLTFDFPRVMGDATTLNMHWGDTQVPMHILVEPTKPAALTAEERDPFLGNYALQVVPLPGWPEEAQMTVTETDDGLLRGWMSFSIHPEDDQTFDLVPAGMNRFSPGLYQRGELFNVEPAVTFEFELGEDGIAKAVVLRAGEGSALATGTRAESAATSR